MTFGQCLLECSSNEEFVAEFDRLTGSSLSKLDLRSGIDRMIDKTTGYEKAQAQKFAAFVYEVVWTRLPLMQAAEPGAEG